MVAHGGPAMPRRRLGAELRNLREQAGLKIEDIAAELECSPSKVSRLETGKGIPKSRDVRDLLDRYGVTDTHQRDRLLRWANQGQGQGWWNDYADVLLGANSEPLISDNYDRYIALEADVGRIESFEPIVVHGLLQTDDYARAILRVLVHHTPPAVVERLVEVRTQRQRRLYTETDPLVLRLVLDEAVLRRPVGGDAVMAGQLRRLLEDGQRDNIDIRVLPFDAGEHQGVAGSFVLLDFPDTPHHDLVCVEGHLGSLYLEKELDVGAYTHLFRSLWDVALDGDETSALIRSVLNRR